ncbi:hypothetical protein FBULB1_13014 [Fusarium bulbicola]|nr:hypothetical protein FBULB1_13014 [Fusarium bulbicola]
MGEPDPIDVTAPDPNISSGGYNVETTSNTSKRANWQVSLIGGACACIIVLIINLGVTIWSSVSLKSTDNNENGEKSSRRIIYEGSCSTSRTLSIVIHLLINIFASILLAASNYGMQCLTAPTRADVDKAHTRKQTYTVDEDFHLINKGAGYYFEKSPTLQRNIERMIAGDFGKIDNLTSLQCINEYAVSFHTTRLDVIVVVEVDSQINESQGLHQSSYCSTSCAARDNSEYRWICGEEDWGCSPCRTQLPKVRSHSDDWRPWGNRVKYCLSEPAIQRCRLNFDFQIAVVILAVNFVKAVALAFIALKPPKEPLFVIGDAIQSFLVSPDEFTVGNCQVSSRMVRAGHLDRPHHMDSKHKRRGIAVTGRRWIFSVIMYGSALCAACALLTWGVLILDDPRDLKSLWNLGFGSANEFKLISGLRWEDMREKSLIWNVLLANLPQLIFSFLYFQYNSLFTCMAAAKEWSDHGKERRSLRVSSNPRGEQRSRYFLQLPYRYSIPLLVASISMHWMLSQSIFIVAVEDTTDWIVFTCGYSPIAIIFVIITAVFMAAAVVITALRRLPTAMPVAASCSLAIAAACHHPDSMPQPDAPMFPLQWGVMWRQREGSGRELTGHCGFSQYPVEKPQDGIVYR